MHQQRGPHYGNGHGKSNRNRLRGGGHHNQQQYQQQLLQQQQLQQYLQVDWTEQDIMLSADLEMFLRSRGDVYESPDGEEQRRDIIEKLHAILCRWIDALGTSRGVPELGDLSYGAGAGVQLKIFGSTRLGVHTPDADIDVLCIAPSWISRQDFFTLFVEALRGRYDVSMVSAGACRGEYIHIALSCIVGFPFPTLPAPTTLPTTASPPQKIACNN